MLLKDMVRLMWLYTNVAKITGKKERYIMNISEIRSVAEVGRVKH